MNGKTDHSTIEQLESRIVQYVERRTEISSAFLFGSAGSENEHRESDVDIAVLFAMNVQPGGFSLPQMRQELSDLLLRDVDLVNLNTAPVVLRMQVLRKGQKVFDRNPRQTDRFVIRTMCEYDDLKRSRKPIEKQLLRGRIYGRP